MKLVSILIPLYNGEQYIAKTLDSALGQTWPNIEIIVIDDGSTDAGASIVSNYQDSRVKLIKSKNGGASSARNIAFDHSKGDYIQYLDADDLLSPEKIEIQMKVMMKENKSTICSSSWLRFTKNPDATIPEPQQVWKDYKRPIEWLIDAWEGGGMMQTSCWLVSRELVKNSGGWSTEISLNDDGEFFSRIILAASSIVYCRDAIVYYRSGMSESLSQFIDVSSAKSIFDSYVLYEQTILKYEDSPRVRSALVCNYQSFIYQFYPDYEDQISKCRMRIKKLGFDRLRPFGGKNAKLLSRLIGFNNMLRIRKLLKVKRG